MADEGTKAKIAERYERAAHRVQTAIVANPDRPRDQYKDLRTGKARAGRQLDGQTWDQMPGVKHG